jgi:hypothetical protein
MTTETQPHYGRGRKPVNDKYIDKMRVGQTRSQSVPIAIRGRFVAGIHEAAYRRQWGIETSYDSTTETLNYRRIK